MNEGMPTSIATGTGRIWCTYLVHTTVGVGNSINDGILTEVLICPLTKSQDKISVLVHSVG